LYSFIIIWSIWYPKDRAIRKGNPRASAASSSFAFSTEFGAGQCLSAAVSLFYMYYNFGRVHQTLRITPAMEAGTADHVWSLEEIVGFLGRVSN